MKTENVSLAVIRQHPEYIRGQHNKNYVEELAQVLADSKGRWPFTGEPILLQPIPSDSTDEKIKKQIVDGAKFWIIDGTHRVAAAFDSKLTEVPAAILPPLTNLDAIALQVKTNMSHGLRLSTATQTNAIKKLKEYGMTGKMIAEKTGLSPSSVSRIVSEKQRNTESGAAGNVDKKGNKKTAKPFKAEDWMKALGKVLKGWEKNGTKIRKAGFPDSCGKALDTIAEALVEG